MPASIFGNPAAVVQLNQALFGIAPGNGKYTNQLAQANSVGSVAFARQLGQTVATSNDALATAVLANVGINNPTLKDALVQAFAAFPNDRGVVVLNLTNILTTLEGNAVYGAAAAQFNAQVATDFQYSTNSVNTADSPVNAGTVTLTANTDILTGNVFTAGLVFTPGGDNRINSLQDEDVLTGTGTNATLNATLGNANDNGGVTITPTLNNIATVNVSFTGSSGTLIANNAVTGLDLQDATGITTVNIDRVSNAVNTARVENIRQVATNLSVNNSNANNAGLIEFSFGATTLAGANTVALGINNTQINTLNIGGDTSTANAAGVGNTSYETVNLTNSGGSNRIGALVLPMDTGNTGAVNITGTTDLRLARFNNVVNAATNAIESVNYSGGVQSAAGSNATGRLSAINATGFTGSLALNIGTGNLTTGDATTSGVDLRTTITGGSGADLFVLNDRLQDVDSINGGAGTDRLVITSLGNVDSRSGTASAVESIEIRLNNSAKTVDFSKLPDAATILVTNETNNSVAGDGGSGTGASGTAPGGAVVAGGNAVFRLDNLSAALAQAITIEHANSNSNAITQNRVIANLTDASGANDTVAVRIQEGVNADERFNFILTTQNGQNANGTNFAGRVENVTLIDADTESNTVYLAGTSANLNAQGAYRGTVTLGTAAGAGRAGTFINLDSDGTGGATDGGIFGVSVGGRDDLNAVVNNASASVHNLVGRVFDQSLTAGQAKQVATLVDGTAELSDIIVRVSSSQRFDAATNTTVNPNGQQTIRTGAGNDTVIFDNVIPLTGDVTAGLTVADTVAAGAGFDTLAIDGNVNANQVINLSASEWTNVSGFEEIALVGAGAGTYRLTLTDALVAANNSNGVLLVTNDNDAFNDVARNTQTANSVTLTLADGRVLANGGNVVNDIANFAESAVVIDGTNLSAATRFQYDGEEGVSRTADRIILKDAAINGNTIIDGGAIDNITDNRGLANGTLPGQILQNGQGNAAGGVVVNNGNLDVLEVLNGAVVSLGDLANIRNIGTLEFTNDQAVAQVSTLDLTDTVVDQLVDSFQASVSRGAAVNTGANVERLNVVVRDNFLANGANPPVNTSTVISTTGLQIQGQALTDRSDLNVVLGRGQNSVVTGSGNDSVVILGNYTAAQKAGLFFQQDALVPVVGAQTAQSVNITNLANNVDQATLRSLAADTLNLGTGTNTVTFVGGISLVGAVNVNLVNVTVTNIASNIELTETQYRQLTTAGKTINALGAGTHTITITSDGTMGALDLTKIAVLGGTLTLNNNSGDATIGGANFNGNANFLQVTAANSPFTLAAAADNLIGVQGDTDAALVVVAGVNPTGIHSSFNANDTLRLTGTRNITGINSGSAIGYGTLDLATDANAQTVTLTLAQHAGLTNITTAGADAITLTTAGTVTALGSVLTYNLGNGVNTFNASANVTNVTGNDGVDTFNYGGNLSIADFINGGNSDDILNYTDVGGTDELNNVTNVDIINISAAGDSSVTAVAGLVGNNRPLVVNLTGVTGAATFNGTAVGATSTLNITGSDGTTGTADDVLTGGAGNDTINGGGGDDMVVGNGGNDSINGGAGNDNISGDGGTDVLVGGDGNDTISTGGNGGGGARDVVAGLAGNDTLNLSVSVDEVHFRSIDNTDTIADNNVGVSVRFDFAADKIHLLDTGATDNATGSVDFAGIADTVVGAAGTDFTLAQENVVYFELADAAAFNAVVTPGSGRVFVINADNVNANLALTNANITNSYVLVDEGANLGLYFDTNWQDAAGRVKIATIVGVANTNDVDAVDFGVYNPAV